jgi:ATP-binding cassette subfamily B (MDR/TAP) protein 1
MFANLVTLDMGYFDQKSNGTGAMASRLAADTALVAAGYGGGLAMIFQAMTSTVLALGFGFYYNWQLTLVLLMLLPVRANQVAVTVLPIPPMPNAPTSSCPSVDQRDRDGRGV